MKQPFYCLPIAYPRDLLAVRQKARRISHLLHFGPHEEACIVAGTFAVGWQAKQLLASFEICFQIENRCLLVFARAKNSENLHQPAIADAERNLLKLRKRIPDLSVLPPWEDFGWMLDQVDHQASPKLFDEVVRQNQEILMFLHELQLVQGKEEMKESVRNNPTAA